MAVLHVARADQPGQHRNAQRQRVRQRGLDLRGRGRDARGNPGSPGSPAACGEGGWGRDGGGGGWPRGRQQQRGTHQRQRRRREVATQCGARCGFGLANADDAAATGAQPLEPRAGTSVVLANHGGSFVELGDCGRAGIGLRHRQQPDRDIVRRAAEFGLDRHRIGLDRVVVAGLHAQQPPHGQRAPTGIQRHIETWTHDNLRFGLEHARTRPQRRDERAKQVGAFDVIRKPQRVGRRLRQHHVAPGEQMAGCGDCRQRVGRGFDQRVGGLPDDDLAQRGGVGGTLARLATIGDVRAQFDRFVWPTDKRQRDPRRAAGQVVRHGQHGVQRAEQIDAAVPDRAAGRRATALHGRRNTDAQILAAYVARRTDLLHQQPRCAHQFERQYQQCRADHHGKERQYARRSQCAGDLPDTLQARIARHQPGTPGADRGGVGEHQRHATQREADEPAHQRRVAGWALAERNCRRGRRTGRHPILPCTSVCAASTSTATTMMSGSPYTATGRGNSRMRAVLSGW